ncbi:MAG TPA: hypothetical protein VM536_09850 [Chloroflexia bacterium]|nr:hypothetical protein [Chloroflexia bacterium]
MADDMKRVVRSDETVVAGTPPQQTVVTQTGTPAVPAVPVQTTVTNTPAMGDRVVAHTSSAAVVDPAAERAAGVDWISRLVWFLVGLLEVLLALRFVLLLTGADPNVGFAQLIYGVTGPFVAPFAGLFGAPLTYEGAATTGRFAPEILVAMVVYALIGWALAKLADLAIGTNRNRGVVVSDVDRQTRV